MLTPKDILSAINNQCGRVQIQYGTESGLGNGGFSFKYISDRAKVDGYSLYMEVDGRYVNPVGPFKKKVKCFIEFRVEPDDFDNNPYRKGSYRYAYSYGETFWGKYYTADAGKLFDKLLDEVICYFEENDKSLLTCADDDNFTYFIKESYEYGEYFNRIRVKHF